MAEEEKTGPGWDPDRPTQVTCPACESLGGRTQRYCTCCKGNGVVTAVERREWLAANPAEKRPTICPSCDGARVLVEDLGSGRYRSRCCPCCRGSGVVSLARAREWRIAHAAGRPNE